MSKFNTKVRGASKTTNHEGAVAYTLDPKMELYAASVTSMLSNKFYEGTGETVSRIRSLVTEIAKTDPEFVARLAVYAREKMYLRSLPLVLLVELARVHSGDSLVSCAVSRVVQRVDEITELLSYYAQANDRTDVKQLGQLSKQIQKGLAAAFNGFDEYQFAKYNRMNKVKLRDALFVVHPKAKDAKQQALFDKIAAGTLEVPYTWEVELSAAGSDHKNKRAVWERMIASGKLGYMAMLRNLRNILTAEVSVESLGLVETKLSDTDEVARSKQFPFRFLSAYREVRDVASGKASFILDALENAMGASAQNISGFGWDDSIAISCDTSGSMDTPVSDRSKIRMVDVGLVLGMLLHNRCKNVETSIFGDTHKVINLPKHNILANAEKLDQYSGMVGYSTNGYLVIQDLIERNEVKDKVMIFTDCQLWDSTNGWGDDYQEFSALWHKYKKEVAPNAKLYLFDLAGYGNTPIDIRDNSVYLIAGWSDKVFDMLDAYEQGSSAISEIDSIEL